MVDGSMVIFPVVPGVRFGTVTDGPGEMGDAVVTPGDGAVVVEDVPAGVLVVAPGNLVGSMSLPPEEGKTVVMPVVTSMVVTTPPEVTVVTGTGVPVTTGSVVPDGLGTVPEGAGVADGDGVFVPVPDGIWVTVGVTFWVGEGVTVGLVVGGAVVDAGRVDRIRISLTDWTERPVVVG